MSTTDSSPYSAMWWIEQYTDPNGGQFWRLKSGAQNTLYVGLPLVYDIPSPDLGSCILNDTPSVTPPTAGQDCQWYPELVSGGGGGLFPPPRP